MPQTYTSTHRPAQRYLSIRSTLPYSALPSLGQKIPVLYGILESTAPPTAPSGSPFFRYVGIPIGMQADQEVDVDVGVPIPERFILPKTGMTEVGKGEGEDEVRIAELPAGQYFETIHIGHPKGLMEATRELLLEAERRGIVFEVVKGAEGGLAGRDEKLYGKDGGGKDVWTARIEWYEYAPEGREEEWRTRLSFKIK